MEPAKKEKVKEIKKIEVKKEKVEIKKEKKSEKKVDKVKKPKKEQTSFDLTEPIEMSLADRLGTLAPLLMATGGGPLPTPGSR